LIFLIDSGRLRDQIAFGKWFAERRFCPIFKVHCISFVGSPMRIHFAWTIAIAGVLTGLCQTPELSGQTQKAPLPVAAVHQEFNNQIMVSLSGNVDARQFARAHGLNVARQFAGVENTWLFNSVNVASATRLSTSLQRTAGVNWIFQNQSRAYELSSFVPNDPFFNNPVAPNNYGGQWHLGNNVSGVPHVNVAGAWNNDVTGAGVMIGIVDTGVEPGQEDLSSNFSATNTYDFIVDSPNQNLLDIDVHGTLVAGVAGARGGNGIGVTGAAPHAGVSALKVFQGNQVATSAGFTNAILFNSTGPDPSIHIKNHSYAYRNPYQATPGEVAALGQTAAAGVIHVFAAGNNRQETGADANTKHLQSSPHQIAVAALNNSGTFAEYSCFGANIFVTAPTHSFLPGSLWITTTDRTGSLGLNQDGTNDYSNTNYTSGMGGTSSSAPLVAGILALGKQANPNMDIRLAKHALARSGVIVDAADATATSDGGWRTNAAGFSFNQNYGFGLVDASAFVDMVAHHEVTPLVVASSGSINVAAAIPDNDLAGITRNAFNGTEGLLEEVLVDLDISHTWRGEIEAYLTSPSGYSSRLMFRNQLDDGDVIDWTFSTNAFWGEQAMGSWSLMVRDVFALDTGTWNSFSIDWRMGTVFVAVPEPASASVITIAALALMTGYRCRSRRVAGQDGRKPRV
jgi:subtilisin family serine protease